MFKFVLIVIALAVGYVIVQSIPDLQRYLRISSM